MSNMAIFFVRLLLLQHVHVLLKFWNNLDIFLPLVYPALMLLTSPLDLDAQPLTDIGPP